MNNVNGFHMLAENFYYTLLFTLCIDLSCKICLHMNNNNNNKGRVNYMLF